MWFIRNDKFKKDLSDNDKDIQNEFNSSFEKFKNGEKEISNIYKIEK